VRGCKVGDAIKKERQTGKVNANVE